MCVQPSVTCLEAGLSIDAIEDRLVTAAVRHHLEERNMAYWLYEIERRSLYEERGFTSIGDYASELIGLTPRKAQYLVFIAHRLAKLPRIADAFDSGRLPWTKAREIVRVATPATENEWLEKAARLTNRELEREVRRLEGRGSGERATLTLSLPVELLEMWTDCYELSERICGSDLEKYQVLEPMMAEYLSTYVAAAEDGGGNPHETEDEKDAPAGVRRAVFERDSYQCVVPGCSMRRMLDLHHLEFRSHGGSHDPANLACVCRLHHGLLHRGVCSLTGTVGVDLAFERPRLFTEKKTEVATRFEDASVPDSTPEPPPFDDPPPPDEDDNDADESWREETVAAIFDGPKPSRERSRTDPTRPARNVWLEWAEAQAKRERGNRAFRRRRRLGRLRRNEHLFADREIPDDHVFAESEEDFTDFASKSSPDTSTS